MSIIAIFNRHIDEIRVNETLLQKLVTEYQSNPGEIGNALHNGLTPFRLITI
ncbi:hypothetical protein EDF68_1328 [Ochrobactrum sp. BH3]|nr:hypothetical protein EDF68_1328 [Ochrobactrum sp. BH3]